MATNWKDVDVQCPYYRQVIKQGIICEGLDDGTITLRFARSRVREAHFWSMCADRWEDCPIAIVLGCKYD